MPGNGDKLRELIERFCPATDIDRDLIEALVVTLFWGGPGGARPSFAVTSDAGRGSGKTKLISTIGRLGGGVLEISANEPIEIIKQRLLSPEGATKRIVLLDNVKSLRFSWAELEALITCPVISGKRMYVGEGSRPNTIVWSLTLNGISLASDMSQRCVVIKLLKPQFSGDWEESTYAFIDANRSALIADCLGFFQRQRALLPGSSRFGTWERDVLSRLAEPSEAQKVIAERQGTADVEREESDIVQEAFESRLLTLQYSPSIDRVFIPSPIVREWFHAATGEKMTTTGAGRWMRQHIEEGKLPRLSESKSHSHGRGLVWTGKDAGGESIRDDIEARIATLKLRDRGA